MATKTTRVTNQGATVTITPAAKAQHIAAAEQALALVDGLLGATPASPLPTAATPTPAPAVAPTVALRGGLAVQAVTLTGKPYRTAAPHNVQWWQAITKACATGPASVAALVVSSTNPHGVPAHFVGYALRRGYLAQPVATTA